MGIKNWQASMFSAMRVAMFQDRFDIFNLYLKLEKASKKYLETGEMQEGDSFRVPLETGTILEISFYKDYSTVMTEIVHEKFYQNPDLAKKLVETGDKYLEEGNTWGDRTRGTVYGNGMNLLGQILMEVRTELRRDIEQGKFTIEILDKKENEFSF